ncbi:MAG: protein kinase [Verrucomicrobiota bacterium]
MKDRLDEEELFVDALDIESPEERTQWLKERCGDDMPLFSRLQTLLDQHASDDRLLDMPVAYPPLKDGDGEESVDDTCGPYRLLEKIGEGGMGDVYRARQNEPIRREVALKIIKPGMDSRNIIARFESERQALALIEHANVARVIDGGTNEAGRPYFVNKDLLHHYKYGRSTYVTLHAIWSTF